MFSSCLSYPEPAWLLTYLRNKKQALIALKQYAEFKGVRLSLPNFRVYDNIDFYVPTPEMVKRLVYRIRSPQLKAAVLISIETGASASEAAKGAALTVVRTTPWRSSAKIPCRLG